MGGQKILKDFSWGQTQYIKMGTGSCNVQMTMYIRSQPCYVVLFCDKMGC